MYSNIFKSHINFLLCALNQKHLSYFFLIHRYMKKYCMKHRVRSMLFIFCKFKCCFMFFLSDGPELICPSTYTVLEYSRHNLTCSRGFPEPMEIWYKDDEEVDLPKILTRGDAGQYWVTASNDHSKINFTVDIIVHCKTLRRSFYISF